MSAAMWPGEVSLIAAIGTNEDTVTEIVPLTRGGVSSWGRVIANYNPNGKDSYHPYAMILAADDEKREIQFLVHGYVLSHCMGLLGSWGK